MKNKLPDACKICLDNTTNNFNIRPHWNDSNEFVACYNYEDEPSTSCLPKDRTIIILLNKLLNK